MKVIKTLAKFGPSGRGRMGGTSREKEDHQIRLSLFMNQLQNRIIKLRSCNNRQKACFVLKFVYSTEDTLINNNIIQSSSETN